MNMTLWQALIFIEVKQGAELGTASLGFNLNNLTERSNMEKKTKTRCA